MQIPGRHTPPPPHFENDVEEAPPLSLEREKKGKKKGGQARMENDTVFRIRSYIFRA